MKLFRHRHKVHTSRSPMKCSLITGVPIQTGTIRYCKCGFEMWRETSGAGAQQLSWGADEESLFDDGPIRPAKGKETEVEAMREAWLLQTFPR